MAKAVTTKEEARHYSSVAVFLHWTMAILIVLQVAGGLTLELYPKPWMGTIMLLHKSTGLTILLLALARLAWRLTHTFPKLPKSIPHWQRIAARANHVAFYVLIIAIPLSGWLMVSSTGKYPTSFWGLFTVPFLPIPADTDRKALHELTEFWHFWLVIGTLGLVVLHVGAALKHHFIDRNIVLMRMLPLWAQPARSPYK